MPNLLNFQYNLKIVKAQAVLWFRDQSNGSSANTAAIQHAHIKHWLPVLAKEGRVSHG
jgi:hypothetical protein